MLPFLLVLAAAAEPLTLREALDRAAKAHPDVLAARLRAVEAEAHVAVSQAAYRPQLNAVIGSAYQTTNLQGIGVDFPGFGGRVGPYRTFNMRPVLTQTVLDLRLLSQMRAAKDNRLAAERQAEATREAAQLAVVELYLQTLQAQSRARAAAARVENTRAALAQAVDRERAGTASKLDVARAEQQHQAERAAHALLLGELAAAKARLTRAVGLDQEPGDLAEPEFRSTELPDAAELVRRGQAQRFDVRALEARQSAARHETEAARRLGLPTFSATGDYGLLGAGPERSLSTYQVGASITIPLWTGGRVQAEHRAARARREVVDQELAQARLRVAEQVRTGLAEWTAARAAEAASAQAKASAREALALSRLRFEGGLATNLDVVSAQSVVASAEDSEIRARYDAWIGRARALHASGDIVSILDIK